MKTRMLLLFVVLSAALYGCAASVGYRGYDDDHYVGYQGYYNSYDYPYSYYGYPYNYQHYPYRYRYYQGG